MASAVTGCMAHAGTGPPRRAPGDQPERGRRPARHRGPGVRPSLTRPRRHRRRSRTKLRPPGTRPPKGRRGRRGRAAAAPGRHRQELRSGAGARRHGPRHSGRPGDRARRRQRRRQVDADQDASPASGIRISGEIFWEGRPVHLHTPKDATDARHRDRLPGPRALRQPGHRAEHVPRPGARPAGRLDEISMEKTAKRDAGRPVRGDGPLGPAAGGVAVGRSAPGRRGGQGRDARTPSW